MNARCHRRRFLHATSLLSVSATIGVATGVRTTSAAPPPRPAGDSKLKTSINAYSFAKALNDNLKDAGSGMSLLEVLDFCAKHGVDGVDPTGYFFPGYPEVPKAEYLKTFNRRVAGLGLGISGTGVRNNFTVPDKEKRAADVRHIKSWVEVAAQIEHTVLRVFADTQMRGQTWETVAKGYTRDQVEEWIAANLKECAEHGEKHKVIIGVQNHGDFLETGEHLLSLVRRVDSRWCGPIVDTGYFRSKDPYDDIALVAPRAVNWQIKESPFGAASPIRTDLKKLLRSIRTSGYQGYLPIETLSVRGQPYDPNTRVPAFLEELREAIAATA